VRRGRGSHRYKQAEHRQSWWLQVLTVLCARTRHGARRRVGRCECGRGAGGPRCVTATSSRWAGTSTGMIDIAEQIAGLGDAARRARGVCRLPRAAGSAEAAAGRLAWVAGRGLRRRTSARASWRRVRPRQPNIYANSRTSAKDTRDGRVDICFGLGSPGDRTPGFEPRRCTDSEPPRYKVLARATLFCIALAFCPACL
jgi:hypothetical protein